MTTATLSTLTIDPSGEDQFFSLDDAPRYVPGRPHRATIWRWALQGIGRNGGRVRLQTLVVGNRRLTTRAWLDDFLRALNAGNPAVEPHGMTPSKRQRQAAAAMAALQEMQRNPAN